MCMKHCRFSSDSISLSTATGLLGVLAWLPLSLLLAPMAHGQGVVIFNNRIAGGSGIGVSLHIWGPSTTAPWLSLTGIGSNDSPSGTTPFGAASSMALIGAGGSGGHFGYATTFAQLIGANGSARAESDLVPVGRTTTFRSGTTLGSLAYVNDTLTGGYLGIPRESPVATFEIVAWDNSSGLYPTWTEARAAWDNGWIAAGHSSPFTITAIGGDLNPSPNLNNDEGNLRGMTSFNLFSLALAPEPSTCALAGLGLAALFVARRRYYR